jgi:uncharacterized membrane protein
MEKFAFATVAHIVAVVLWIGGVAMVTMVLLPVLRGMDSPEEAATLFERLQTRFAWQARIAVLLTGLSGFYMLDYVDGWGRYTDLSYWWVHAMTAVWAIFMLVLFVIEPLFLHRWFVEHAKENPARTFTLTIRLHRVLLIVSLVTVVGAVAGTHGWFFV